MRGGQGGEREGREGSREAGEKRREEGEGMCKGNRKGKKRNSHDDIDQGLYSFVPLLFWDTVRTIQVQ